MTNPNIWKFEKCFTPQAVFVLIFAIFFIEHGGFLRACEAPRTSKNHIVAGLHEFLEKGHPSGGRVALQLM